MADLTQEQPYRFEISMDDAPLVQIVKTTINVRDLEPVSLTASVERDDLQVASADFLERYVGSARDRHVASMAKQSIFSARCRCRDGNRKVERRSGAIDGSKG
jgi:hypothetical protein